MEEDFVASLGYISLDVRLKRISDTMVHAGRQMYKRLGVDIEPHWFLVLILLEKKLSLSITEIADEVHFSHPSIITMVNKMKKAGYVQSHVDPVDSRRQLVQLTQKAYDKLPAYRQIWEAGITGIEKMLLDHPQFLQALDALERQYREADFMERTLNEYTYVEPKS